MGDSRDMFGNEAPEGDDEAPPSAAELEEAGQSALFGEPVPAAPSAAR